MREFLVSFCIIFVFMTISNIFGWGKLLWKIINKRIKAKYNFVVFVVFAGILGITVPRLCNIIGVPYNNITVAVILGFYLAFMPPFAKVNK